MEYSTILRTQTGFSEEYSKYCETSEKGKKNNDQSETISSIGNPQTVFKKFIEWLGLPENHVVQMGKERSVGEPLSKFWFQSV